MDHGLPSCYFSKGKVENKKGFWELGGLSITHWYGMLRNTNRVFCREISHWDIARKLARSVSLSQSPPHPCISLPLCKRKKEGQIMNECALSSAMILASIMWSLGKSWEEYKTSQNSFCFQIHLCGISTAPWMLAQSMVYIQMNSISSHWVNQFFIWILSMRVWLH